MPEISRRPDDAARIIAKLGRRLDDLERRVSRRGHGHVLGYAEQSSSQSGISSETTVTDLQIQLHVRSDRLYKVSANVSTQKDGTEGVVACRIYAGTSGLSQIARGRFFPLAFHHSHFSLFVLFTPSTPGDDLFRVTLAASAGDVTATAAPTEPNYLLIEDIGPA